MQNLLTKFLNRSYFLRNSIQLEGSTNRTEDCGREGAHK